MTNNQIIINAIYNDLNDAAQERLRDAGFTVLQAV